ncbi:MAG: SDR family oxidoreductase, partial [Chloroflexota bacterium]
NFANATAVKELLATISQQHGPVGGLFHLLPLAGQMAAEEMTLVAWRSYLGRDVKSLFYLLKEITSLHPSSSTSHPSPFVLAAGSFERYPGQAGLSGLLKTAAKEWPTWRVQCLDLDDSEPADVLAGQIWQEFAADEPSVVVRYHQQQRQVWRPSSVPMDQQTAQLSLDGDSVILLTGGAQGITAEIALELAQHYRPKLILVGRSPLPPAEEDSLTAHLSETKAIKAALFQRAQQSGRPVALAEVERATQRLLKEREMRRVLAELRAAGATVHYYAADVRDEAALHDLLAEVYREYGRLDGIIHGAGVIEDKLIVDKAADSFDRVFDTKADSAFLLSRLVETMGEARPPRFLAFFSSAAGVFGNRGQADYAAANALLNQMAAYLDGRWPGRVVSLAWGPWARTGMVSEELRKQFAAQGMPLVEVAAGRQAFHRELLYGHKGQPEVVYAGGLEAAATWQDGHRNGQVSHALSRPVIHTAAGGQRLPASEDASLHYVGPEVSPNGHRRTNGNGQHPLPLPLLNGHSVHHQGHQVEVSRLLDPQVDRYLLDHQLDGRPVLPAAMALELMAEVVQKGWPDLEVVGVREMQLLRGVILDDDRPRPLRVVATAQAHAPHDRVGANVDVQITAAGHPHLTHYRATVELASHLPLPPRYRLPESLESFPLSAAEAYERWLFHGPLFQAIAGIEGIGPADMVLDIRPSDPQEVLAGPAAGEWLFDPIVVDSGLQAIILWARATMNKTPLVTAVGHFRRYAPFSGRSVKGHLRILNGGANQTLIFNMAFVDGHGRLLGLAEQVTCPYSEALNRLAKQYLVNSIQ